MGDYVFLEPVREMKIAELDEDINISDLIGTYLARRHVGLEASSASLVAYSIEYITLWSRLQFFCGSDSQTVYSEKVVHSSYAMGRENVRPSCYVSVEVDATDMKADI